MRDEKTDTAHIMCKSQPTTPNPNHFYIINVKVPNYCVIRLDFTFFFASFGPRNVESVGVILVLVLQKVNSFWITWLWGLELDHHLCLHTMDMDGIKILRVCNWKQPQFHVNLLLIQ